MEELCEKIQEQAHTLTVLGIFNKSISILF